MRFTGRIRFDDVRNADLDVTVEVTDTHVRVMSGEESLGSWCLADVVANRLVANEFEIDLGGEAITFLADDQVNFAYGAVQKMAEGWARYHAMNLVRRKRAVAAARRHNETHRLEAVRQAFVSARRELQRPVPEPVEMPGSEPEPEPEVVVEPEPEETEPDETRLPTEAPTASVAAPGFWERVERATAAEETHGDSAEAEEEPLPAIPLSKFAGRLPRLNALPRRPIEDAPAASVVVEEEPTDSEAGGDEIESPSTEIAEPIESRTGEEAQGTVAPVEEAPTALEQAEEANGHRLRRERAALGSYRDGHHPSETSGLRASLRSLLSRSNDPHEHSFVESTTAVGITRRVCLECGHVSIGVSE